MEKPLDLFSQFSNMAIQYAPKVILALITFIIGSYIISWLTGLLNKGLERRGVDFTILPFLTSLVNIGLKIMLLLSVAGMFGIQTTSFIAIFTALAFAVGTALSGSLGHFASGVLILIFKPYKVGDLVTLVGQTGVVAEIQVFNTVLLTRDNKKIIIPNGNITSGVMTNISGQGQIRVDMVFSFTDNNDIDKVRAVVQQVSDSCSQILKNPPINIFVKQSPTGMIEFDVSPMCLSDDYWDVYYFMQENVRKALSKNNTTMSSATTDVLG